jgi:hypothetical protein
MSDEGRDVVEEVAERLNALAASGEPEGAPAEETPAPAPAEAPAPTPPAGDSEVEVGGKKYSRAELEELLSRGTLRQDDYTRKTQQIAAEKRAIEEQRESITRQQRLYEEALARLAGGKSSTTEEVEAEEDLELSPAMRRVLKREREAREALAKELTGLREGREEEQRQEQQGRVNGFIVEHADTEIRALMKAKEIPDSMFRIIRQAIAFENPNTSDPITGELTAESVKHAIRQHFDQAAKDLLDWKTSIATTTVQGLKKAAPKPPPGPGLRPSTPGAPAKNGRPAKVWEDAETVDEVVSRMTGVFPGGDYAP